MSIDLGNPGDIFHFDKSFADSNHSQAAAAEMESSASQQGSEKILEQQAFRLDFKYSYFSPDLFKIQLESGHCMHRRSCLNQDWHDLICIKFECFKSISTGVRWKPRFCAVERGRRARTPGPRTEGFLVTGKLNLVKM